MLVRNLYFSLEAAIRGWLDGKANYFEPIPLGGAIRGPSVARVVSSRLEGFSEGDIIFGLHHWEDYSLSEEVIEHTVIAVQGNYLDEYLVRLERTWVRSMEVQKELGYINDYSILVATAADSPNVWLSVEYPNMAAYQPNEEKWNKVNEILAER